MHLGASSLFFVFFCKGLRLCCRCNLCRQGMLSTHLRVLLRLGLSPPGSFRLEKALSASSVHRSLELSPRLRGEIMPCSSTPISKLTLCIQSCIQSCLQSSASIVGHCVKVADCKGLHSPLLSLCWSSIASHMAVVVGVFSKQWEDIVSRWLTVKGCALHC